MSNLIDNLKVILPYDRSNPIVYDNDSHEDMYTDEYIMALAASGDISLKGIITTISYVDAWQKPEIQFETVVNGREELVGIAHRSGMKNIPKAVTGPLAALKRPSTGRIEDTLTIDSPGSRLIVEEAQKACKEKPLVIIMGGQSTVVADAYLLDPTISEKVIIAWNAADESGTNFSEYNGWVDPWGTYIIISKFKTVIFGPVCKQVPIVPKRQLIELPDTELRNWMIEMELPHVNLPNEMDGDAQPVIPLMRPDYVKEVILKSFSHFDQNGIPILKEDEKGNIIVVTDADKDIATEEWWRAMKDLRAYGGNPIKASIVPYNSEPFVVPGRIAAAQFDFGGEGVSYHCRSSKNGSQVLKTAYRMTDHVKFEICNEQKDMLAVEQLECNEWLKYTVNVKKAGKYKVEVNASSGIYGGVFHLESDGINKCSVTIPGTGGWQEWQTVVAGEVILDSGLQVLRLVCDSGRFNLNYLEFIQS